MLFSLDSIYLGMAYADFPIWVYIVYTCIDGLTLLNDNSLGDLAVKSYLALANRLREGEGGGESAPLVN